MRRKRGIAAAALIAVAGVVVFIELREPRRPSVAFGAEESGDPPPYPFLEHSPGPVERRFTQQKINLNFDGTPFADALDTVKELTSVPVELDPALAKAAEKSTVTLKVRDITVGNALNIILTCSPVDASPVFEREKVVIVPSGRVPPRPLWQRISTEAFFKGWQSGSEPEPAWVTECKKRLATQKVTFNFSATPFSEVVQFLQDFTNLNVTVHKSVDTEATKLDLRLRDVVAGDALAIICEQVGLEVSYRNETLQLRPKRPRSPLLDKKVSFDLRGAKTPDLVAAFEKQGLPILASREAWDGRGTFSLFLDDVPLEGAIAAIRSATALKVAFVGEPEPIVAVGGTVPSVAAALAAKVTPEYVGVKKQLAEHRVQLTELVGVRDTLRATGAKATLLPAEQRVQEQVNTILELERVAKIYDGAPARLAEAVAELAKPNPKGWAKYDKRVATRLVAGRELLLKGAKLVQTPWGYRAPEGDTGTPY